MRFGKIKEKEEVWESRIAMETKGIWKRGRARLK